MLSKGLKKFLGMKEKCPNCSRKFDELYTIEVAGFDPIRKNEYTIELAMCEECAEDFVGDVEKTRKIG